MTTLTEAERTILAATRFYCDCTDAYCSLRNELDRAVEQILAAREAAGVAPFVALKASWSAALDNGCPSCGPVDFCDHIEGYHHALSDLRAELLRQGGEE